MVRREQPRGATLPRDFFHLQFGQDLPDDQGTVLPGPEQARGAAVRTAGEMIESLENRFWDSPEWGMPVTDEEGQTVCDLRFSGTAGVS